MKTDIRVLVFDFDEVVVKGSDAVKQRAWQEVFLAFGDAYREPLKAAHARFGHGRGGDRFTIMDAVFRALGISESEMQSRIAIGSTAYDAFVQKGILAIGVSSEARTALALLTQKYPMYINTATPEAPFAKTYEALGLGEYFRGFYGRPNDKVTNLALIAQREDVQPHEMLFIGDAPKDLEAVERFGCSFVGFATAENRWSESVPRTPIIEDIAELPDLLR